MAKWSVKKEIIPHGTQLSCKPVDGALISFSGMKSALALFSQPGAFVSFVGTKEKERRLRSTDHYQGTGSWSFRDCVGNKF